jgi:AAA+ ATPase superfamily predicted ATPase
MKPNPGGVITGNAIIDRENDIQMIWTALKNQSVVLISERRIGKTSVLRKMTENPKDGWIPVLYWVEGKSEPIDFVEGLYRLIIEKEILEESYFKKFKNFYIKYAGGTEIASFKLPQIREKWKDMFENLVNDIVDSKKKVLLIFDEIPVLIHKFIHSKDLGPNVGMDFLDLLRAIRNKYEATGNIAFIFCGSIGIHLVIKNLKINHNYNSDPVNNMKILTLNSMSPEGAGKLCRTLIENEGYEFRDADKIIEYICLATDRLPFYIQHVFDYMYNANIKKITEDIIDEAVNYLLSTPEDIGCFKHYIDRIKTYYDKPIQEMALTILDEVSRKDNYCEESQMIDIINTQYSVNIESIKETIDLLWSDHYLSRDIIEGKRCYKFKYILIKKWWKLNRG